MKYFAVFILVGMLIFSSAASAAEKRSGYSIELLNYKQKLRTIGEIKAITGLSLKESKQIVDGVPSLVRDGLSKDEAVEIQERLAATGAEVKLIAPMEAEEQAPDYLYVLTARSGLFDGDTLVLNQIPFAVYFSDMPKRYAGQMSLVEFFKNWGAGTDSFEADPPKARLSILGEKENTDVVVEISHPILKDDIVSCTVKLIEGKIPGSFGPCSLFVDSE